MESSPKAPVKACWTAIAPFHSAFFHSEQNFREYLLTARPRATQRVARHLVVFTENAVKCTRWSAKYIQSLKRARPIRANHFHVSLLRTEDALQEQRAKLFFLMLIVPPTMFVSLARHGNYVKNTKILDQLPCLQTWKNHNPDGQQKIQNVCSGRKKEENWRLWHHAERISSMRGCVLSCCGQL